MQKCIIVIREKCQRKKDIIFAKFPATVPDHEPAHVLQLVDPDHGGRALVLHLQEDSEALLGAVETPVEETDSCVQMYRTGSPGVQASLKLVPGLQQTLLRHREARVLLVCSNVTVHPLLLDVLPQVLLS